MNRQLICHNCTLREGVTCTANGQTIFANKRSDCPRGYFDEAPLAPASTPVSDRPRRKPAFDVRADAESVLNTDEQGFYALADQLGVHRAMKAVGWIKGEVCGGCSEENARWLVEHPAASAVATKLAGAISWLKSKATARKQPKAP